MPHFYKRLAAMVLMCALSIGAVRGLPVLFPASSYGELHYTPITETEHGIVMTAAGNGITAEEYAYYFVDYANAWNNMLASLGMNWSSIWTEDQFLEQVRSSVDQELSERQAAIDLVNQYNLHLTRAQIDEAMELKQASIESLGGEEAFREQLHSIGMTEDIFNNRMYSSYIYTRLNDYLFGEGGQYRVSDEEVQRYMNENYLRAKHVLISSETENAEGLAKEVAERAKNGEDFDSLIAAYGEDPGMAQQPEGYVFKEGDMIDEGDVVDEFYQVASALGEGEISEPVKNSFGWYIIERLPFDVDYVARNHDTLVGYMETYTLDDLLAERAAAMDVTRNEELYQAIDLYTVQDYLVGAGDTVAADDGANAAGGDTAPAEEPAAGDAAGEGGENTAAN